MPSITESKNRRRKSKAEAIESPGPERWEEWSRHLQRRKRPRAFHQLYDGRRSSLLWSVPDNFSDFSFELVQKLDRVAVSPVAENGRLAGMLEEWLADAVHRAFDASLALEALAWTHCLPALARTLTAAPWCELFEWLKEMAQNAASLPLAADPLDQQLWAGELPMALGFVLPELTSCQQLAQQGGRTVSHGLIELTDGEGVLQGKYSGIARPLFACWTRCLLLGEKDARIDGGAANQFRWLVQQMLRQCRADGSQLLSSSAAGAWTKNLFRAALDWSGDEEDRRIASVALPGRAFSGKKGRVRGSIARLPSPTLYSEWAEYGVLRSSWDRESVRLAVDFSHSACATELAVGRHVLWSGATNLQVTREGVPLFPTSAWTETCRYADEDVEYLELEIALGDSLSLERQFLLAPRDGFCLIADALVGETSQRLSYRLTLPLTPGTDIYNADATRELFLHRDDRVAGVLPLSLPEWSAAPTPGMLQQSTNGLELRLETAASKLYAPLFINFHRKRLRSELTWRQLTVAEKLEIQSSATAVGYRVQIGKKQWLFYRSLAAAGNRTVLFQNLSSQFLVGRFGKTGDVETIIEIE